MNAIVSPPTAHRAGSFRELSSVALPLVISYTTSALMYVADRIFLSWDSVEALAAALPAGVLHYNLAALGIAFAVIPLLYIAIMLYRERGGMYHLWTGRRFDRALFGRLLKFGLPSGVQQFLDIACFTIFIQLVGGLGTEQLSATSLVFNLNSLVFVPMIGLGTAVTAIVGRRIGEGRPQLAIRTTWLAAGLGMAYVAMFTCLYLLAPQAVLKLYGLEDHESLRALVVFLLKLVAVYSFFDALAMVFSSAIRGAGDTRFALIFSVSLGVVLLVIPTFIASFYGEAGFYYAWYAVTIFITTLGLGFIARFQQGKWMTMRVIEHTRPELEGSPPIEKDSSEESDDGILESAIR